ncbi:MAG: hypothetical protein K0S65_5872, partial [Labilithrix sp.]|nr:hypothetical protein [Labilithrix sp.]
MTLRSFAFIPSLLVAFAGFAAACGDDAPPRPSFDEVDSSGGGVEASLPEAAAPDDAGSAPDVKDPYPFEDEEVVCAGDAGACAKEIVAGDGHFCARMA